LKRGDTVLFKDGMKADRTTEIGAATIPPRKRRTGKAAAQDAEAIE